MGGKGYTFREREKICLMFGFKYSPIGVIGGILYEQ